MKNNHIKAAITCTSIALITTALASEVIIAKSEATTKSKTAVASAEKTTLKKEAPKADLAITIINKEILSPIKLQENTRHTFSRSMPTRSNSYELVEISSEKTAEARYFDILVTSKNIRTWKAKLVTNSENAKTKEATPTKPEAKHYLKLKYLTASNKVLIKQKDEWVEKSKHKYLMFLPVAIVDKK